MVPACSFPHLTADEAAAFISNGQMVAFSGFTPAGAAKVVPPAIARRARHFHERGEAFKIRVLTGASTGPELDQDVRRKSATTPGSFAGWA